MSDYKAITFEVDNHVATITMNRPEAANGLNLELAHDLLLAAIECDENPDIRAVILTGSGKMFCAGGDLKAFASDLDRMPALIKQLTTYLHSAISRFARMDAPVIVAVNGAAAGAGFSTALIGDIVLAAESASFTMAYTAAGLTPDGSSSYFMPRLIGLRKTQELMLTNRRLSAAEAQEWGLVTKVVADDALKDEAWALASQLAAGPTKAFGGVKRMLSHTFDQSLDTQMEIEARTIADAAKTADAREGVSAFLSKRKPEFNGH